VDGRQFRAFTVADVDSVLANKVNEQQYAARGTNLRLITALVFPLCGNALLVWRRYSHLHYGTAVFQQESLSSGQS
jgi:hypothetical protein